MPDELELLLDELDELEELLEELDDELLELEELEELLLDEELEDELDEELLLDEELELGAMPLIVPTEAVRVTLSSRAPSSRRTIRSVCKPAARLLKVAMFSVAYPLVAWLFCVTHEPVSIL
jgi:hypothetical protein